MAGDVVFGGMLTVSWSDVIRASVALVAMTAASTAGLMLVPSALRRSVLLLRALAVVEVLTAIVWLVADEHFEGHVIWAITAHHGLTQGDLAAVVPLLVAGVLIGRSRRTRQPVRAEPEG